MFYKWQKGGHHENKSILRMGRLTLAFPFSSSPF
jgi:hypothetical protein